MRLVSSICLAAKSQLCAASNDFCLFSFRYPTWYRALSTFVLPCQAIEEAEGKGGGSERVLKASDLWRFKASHPHVAMKLLESLSLTRRGYR